MSRLATTTWRVAARMILTSPSNDIKRAPAGASSFAATFFNGLPYFQTYRLTPPPTTRSTSASTPRYKARFWITHQSRSKWLTFVDIVYVNREEFRAANKTKHRLTHGHSGLQDW